VTNESSDPRDIVAGDIQVLKNRGAEEEPLLVPNVQFFHPDPVTHDTALLTVLKGKLASQEPETLEFTAVATMGTGRENAAFMPVTSRCAYGSPTAILQTMIPSGRRRSSLCGSISTRR
jgi:hypothetical protein